eukprot:SAG31_NODE_8630_length_1417_cov_1.307284_2_plen_56_part_01
MLAPWAVRYYVLAHYKGPEFTLPKSDPNFEPYFRWLAAMEALPAVRKTSPPRKEYL